MYEFEVLLKNGEHTFIWGYSFDDAKRRNPKTATEIETIYSKNILIKEMTSRNPGGFSICPRLAVGARRGQFFVSIGNLHNFPYAFLVNLTKEIFPKSLDFLCRLWYTCIIKREERTSDGCNYYSNRPVVFPICLCYRARLHGAGAYVWR